MVIWQSLNELLLVKCFRDMVDLLAATDQLSNPSSSGGLPSLGHPPGTQTTSGDLRRPHLYSPTTAPSISPASSRALRHSVVPPPEDNQAVRTR